MIVAFAWSELTALTPRMMSTPNKRPKHAVICRGETQAHHARSEMLVRACYRQPPARPPARPC